MLSYPVQAEAGAVGDHHSNSGIQRRDCHIQECQVQRLGKCEKVVLACKRKEGGMGRGGLM